MASIESNKSAWINAANAKPLQVGPGPDQTKPEADEVVIQVAAVAINPSEWKFQDYPYVPVTYPHVLGSDAAGTVVRVGSGITRFKPGDRVIGHCGGLTYGGARHGAFQSYTTCREAVVATIPDSLKFEQAVVLPLGLSTSSCGLHELLKLRLPTSDADSTSVADSSSSSSSKPKEFVLIWGGSSSMGTVAIQLATAASYQVITTASKKNHDYVRSLAKTDAIVVFDHSDPEVASQIIGYVKSCGGTFAGAFDCISGEETVRACAEVVHAFGGGVLPVVMPSSEARYDDVKLEVVWATKPGFVPGHPGAELWASFVPKALESGVLQAKPDPIVLGCGLDKIQEAMDIQKKGVSARKIVVTL